MDLLDVFYDGIADELRKEIPEDIQNNKFIQYINEAIDEIHVNYTPKGLNEKSNSLDYKNIYLRCAYVYLYSTSHSHMVADSFRILYDKCPSYLSNVIERALSEQGELRYCSIGGGPGSDIVGTLLFLKERHLMRDNFVKVQLIDGYPEWAETFYNIKKNFDIRNMFPRNSVKVTCQDLLNIVSPITKKAIQQAHLITIVKFVSAISSDLQKTRELLGNIFTTISIGTLVLLIDNAGGPPFQLILDIAEKYDMKAVVPPIKHVLFKVDARKEPFIYQKEFRKPPQNQGKVSFVFLEKIDLSQRGKKRARSLSGERNVDDTNRAQSPLLIQYGESTKVYMPYATPSREHRIVEGKDESGHIFFTATPARINESSSAVAMPDSSSKTTSNDRILHCARRRLSGRSGRQLDSRFNSSVPSSKPQSPSHLRQDRKRLRFHTSNSSPQAKKKETQNIKNKSSSKGRSKKQRKRRRSFYPEVASTHVRDITPVPNTDQYNFRLYENTAPNFQFGPVTNEIFNFSADHQSNQLLVSNPGYFNYGSFETTLPNFPFEPPVTNCDYNFGDRFVPYSNRSVVDIQTYDNTYFHNDCVNPQFVSFD